MPLDYAIHDMGAPVVGNMLPAPILPAVSLGEVKLAEATNSQDITIGQGGAVLVCVASVDLRLDVRLKTAAGSLNPAASGLVLSAGVPRFFMLRAGVWTLKTALW